MTAVHTLTPVSVTDVWPCDGQDFTPWLAEHPDFLAGALEMDLELEGAGVTIGSFAADLVFKATDRGRRVVVENLLERPDCDDLGKLIEYPTGVEDAGYGVLITQWLGPKRRSALNWLNSVTKADSGFFGIELEVYRIDNSPPAVKVDVVVRPDDRTRIGGISTAWSTVGAKKPAPRLVGGASR